MSPEAPATASERRGSVATSGDPRPACCPYYHEAVELIGRRWTGAIVAVLLDGGPLRFSEISPAPPAGAPWPLSETPPAVPERRAPPPPEHRREREARGVVPPHVDPGPPVKVLY